MLVVQCGANRAHRERRRVDCGVLQYGHERERTGPCKPRLGSTVAATADGRWAQRAEQIAGESERGSDCYKAWGNDGVGERWHVDIWGHAFSIEVHMYRESWGLKVEYGGSSRTDSLPDETKRVFIRKAC